MSVELASHYCEEVINTRKPMRLPNATTDPRWKNAPEIEYGIIAYLGYPICWPDGEMFGTICVLDSKENQFTTDQEGLVEQFRNMVEAHLALVNHQQTIERQNAELHQRLDEIQTLRGIIPICCHCKRVRDDAGYWEQVEGYVRRHSCAEFSHGLCPECLREHYPEYRPG